MKNREEIESFNHAVSGILKAIKLEGHMRVHYTATVLVLFSAMFFNLSRMEFITLVLTCGLVIMAEMFNTCIEKILDLVSPDYNPLVRTIKDISAGAVLVVSVCALLVGYLLFFDRVGELSTSVIERVKQSYTHLTFISFCMVILLIVGIKAKFSKHGTFFKGGQVSGHSAVAFCIATLVSLIARNFLIMAMVIFMAALVAESRVESEIHSLSEVVLGGFLGVAVALLVFSTLG